MVKFVCHQVVELQKAAAFCQQNMQKINVNTVEEIKLENDKLRREIEIWKGRLIKAETKLGIEQVLTPTITKKETSVEPPPKVTQEPKEKEKSVEKKKPEKVKAADDESKKASSKQQPTKAKKEDELPVDVRRLDIRVGKIINVKKHPDADSLYVEEVDVGEDKPRTVVSGLVKYVPIEEMQNRMVVALCNLKPAKMRGVTSEAMVLCASTQEKVEVLIPPPGSCPGDRITVEGYPGDPDPVLNPKKKIFETVAPDLKTDGKKIATYKGVPFSVTGKGVVTTQSLIEVQIK